MNLLPWLIYLSFAGALLSWLVGERSPDKARTVALLTALAGLGISLAAAFQFQPAASLQTLVKVPWVEGLADYHLAVDGISMTLVVLTGIAATAGVLFSWNIKHRTGDFFALFLALIGGVYGVFMSADAFLLFVFYEIAIVPKYFLVAVWGSTNREYGAMKLVLYSFAGSALVMAGLLWAKSAGVPFNMTGLGSDGVVDSAKSFVEAARHLSTTQQTGMFALIFTGFAVLAGMFPFHTWAPTGHVAAPTGASMLLAGVVMKLGAYGCLRVALPAFPAGFETFQPVIAALAIVGILYAGLVALVQTDFKFVIGYSSVSHMGFVLLGLAAATTTALSGAVLQMFSHGVVAGLLFAVVGRMVYERTHTRDLNRLHSVALYRLLPFAAVLFVFAGLASMGMPGFSGFPAELSILIGTWEHNRTWAVLAALGIPIAAAFTLRAVAMAFFGKPGAAQLANEKQQAGASPEAQLEAEIQAESANWQPLKTPKATVPIVFFPQSESVPSGKKSMAAILRGKIVGVFHNESQNIDVRVNNKTILESLDKMRNDLCEAKVLEELPSIIKGMVLLEKNSPKKGTVERSDGRKSHIFYAPVLIEKNAKIARIVVHEMQERSASHHNAYSIFSIKIENAAQRSGQLSPSDYRTFGSAGMTHAELLDFVKRHFKKESKEFSSTFRKPGRDIAAGHDSHAHADLATLTALPPITLPEKAGAVLLLAVSVLIGLKPNLLLDWIIPALNSPLMKIVPHGGAQ